LNIYFFNLGGDLVFKVGEYVVYRRDVCKVVEIREKHLNNDDYYILIPVFYDGMKIEVPVANRCEGIKSMISIEEIRRLINEIPNISIIVSDNRLIENEYKALMYSGKHEDLIKIIKTTYLRNKERKDNRNKPSDKDDTYFRQAEKYLYEEFSIVLGMSYDDTRNYVVNEVEKII
jgi:CarD family transcriptional regulator